MRKVAAVILFALLALPGAAAAQDASPIPVDPTLVGATAQWQVCNDTSYVLRTASAFLRGGTMAAKGWNEVLPGGCIAITTPASGPRFLFAESIAAHQGGVREWKGTTPLCVDEAVDFTSPATENCAVSGRAERNFFAVRPGEPVTTLVEPSEYGAKKARIAAQQRLLRDAGYAITRIDGLPGRKTSRLLRAFRKDQDLNADIDDSDLMRALIEASLAAQTAVGLEICNQTSAAIWAAIALQEEGRWRSRGWWHAEPDACIRPLDIPLTDLDVHVYAVQETEGGPDKRLRTVATTPAQFCIAESKFDALGNDMCIEQGYSVASFRPVTAEDKTARVRLTDADFSEQTPGGLRR